jgi:bacteriocin biosynthesis cyclodehydratase domain-containing protein
MSTFPLKKPRLPSHYYIRFEPPDASGDEVLLFESERRTIRLKGRSFREFLRLVVPILDGTRSLTEIQTEVGALFGPDDLERCLALLAEYNILQDAEPDTMSAEERAQLEPQLNFFHELGLNPHEVQAKLKAATVAVWGLGGTGSTVALALAAAQVGHIRCVDWLPVSGTDPHLTAALLPSDVGRNRAEVVCARIALHNPRVTPYAVTEHVHSDADALRILDGTDLVICCADAGMSSQFYILNRVCLRATIPWTSCAVSGLEGIVGPTIVPRETPCYLCYKMRAVACAPDPEDQFKHERFLDQRKQDDSSRRENHPFGIGVIANLAGLEAIKSLTGIAEPSALGRIIVVDFLTLACRKHVILRKPWCPACSAASASSTG